MADPYINNGIGVVWGISTNLPGSGTAYLMPTEEDHRKSRQNEQHYDKIDGSVIAETFWRRESTLRIQLYPAGSDNSNAINANRYVWEPGTQLVLTDINDPDIDGTWVIVEVGKQRRFADKVYIEFSLRRFGNIA